MIVVSTIRVRLKLRRAVKPSQQKRLNLEKLKDPNIRTEFSIRLQNRFLTLADTEEQLEETGVDIDKLWLEIKNTCMEAGTSTLGYVNEKRKKHG